MADANTTDKSNEFIREDYVNGHLSNEDIALFDHHFYWQYDGLFMRIKNEMAAIKRCIEALQSDSLQDEAMLSELQARLDRLKKVQVIINDRGLDDFKEIIYPMAKFVPALALIGAGGVSVVVGPVFAFLFAVAFLTSNLYLKGKNSMLNLHFGIASTIQATAVILAILSISGVIMINPGVISSLIAVGGIWLFCAAVFRGGERQKEARDVKLAAIDKSMRAFYQQLESTKKKITKWSIDPSIGLRHCAEMDDWINHKLFQPTLDIDAKELRSRFKIDEADAKEMRIEIRKLKLFYDAYAYYCQDYENLLRTVKNPFEKYNRVADLGKIQMHAKQLSGTCGEFTALAERINQKAEDTKDNITFVMKRDMPWLVTNIPMIVLVALTVPIIGGLILGAPLLLSPHGLMAIGAIAITVGIISLCFYGWEKYRCHRRAIRDAEKQNQNEILNLRFRNNESPQVSGALKRRSKKGPPMLLNIKKAQKQRCQDVSAVVGKSTDPSKNQEKSKNKDQKA